MAVWVGVMWVGVRTEVMRGWIGEMRLSARNGKRVDWRNEGGSEKNERIGLSS